MRAVWQGGGNPVTLPWVSDAPADILDEIDGLILSGGGDIEPGRFAQEPHPETDRIDEGRVRDNEDLKDCWREILPLYDFVYDPEAVAAFATRSASAQDRDEKRHHSRMEKVDTNGDGLISRDEFLARHIAKFDDARLGVRRARRE